MQLSFFRIARLNPLAIRNRRTKCRKTEVETLRISPPPHDALRHYSSHFLPTLLLVIISFCLITACPNRAEAVVYQFPWYGVQGEGGYFKDHNDETVYPGIDLVEVSSARSVVLWGATFPGLADNSTDIEPDGLENHDYYKLFCDGIEYSDLKLQVAQKYIQENGLSSFSAIIKVRTGQSDGNEDLCDEGGTPFWSHVCSSAEWKYNQLVSATPNDLSNPDYCSNTSDPEYYFDPDSEFYSYSENLFHFAATLADGCSRIYGNRNYSFENECDLHWAGLGPEYYQDCVPDGPYTETSFSSIGEAENVGRHLAHHYMQSYFSFKHGIKHEFDVDPELEDEDHFAYPFGISSLGLGLMIGRWIVGEDDPDLEILEDEERVDEAMRFSNKYFAEVQVSVLKGMGMTNIYQGLPGDKKPWPLGDDTERKNWLYDFGYMNDLTETNKLAIFHSTFIKTIYNYMAKDVQEEWEYKYFDGLVVHYYSHWSCIPKTIEYLNYVRDVTLKGAAEGSGEGVAVVPVVIDELGNRRRLESFEQGEKCWKCDKTIEYETGWSRNRIISDPDMVDELIDTQASETARSLIMFSARNEDGSGNNIRGVMWEWMMKPAGSTTDKCGIVLNCGRSRALPGYRYPAFDAYRFFVYIINRLIITPKNTYIVEIETDGPTIEQIEVDLSGAVGDVTAYWCYDPSLVYSKDISCNETVKVPSPNYYQAYIYNAVGDLLETQTFAQGQTELEVYHTTSPRYISWNKPIYGDDWPEDDVDNYSEVAFLTNTGSGAWGIASYKFDAENMDVWDRTNPFSNYSDIRGLAWLEEPNRLIVSCNNDAGKPEILKLYALTGAYDSTGDIDVHAIDNNIREIRGIATNYVLTGSDQVSEVIHAIVDKGTETVSDYKLDTYYHDGNAWVKANAFDFNYCIPLPAGTPDQIRIDDRWVPDFIPEPKYSKALFISMSDRIIYLDFADDGGFEKVAFENYTVSDATCNYNGFGFALDGNLYVSDGDPNNKTRKYIIPETGAVPPYSNVSDIITFTDATPMGLRITPFGTLGITVGFDDGGGKVVEYVNDAAGSFSSLSPRTIADISDTDLIPGDLEYSYNR